MKRECHKLTREQKEKYEKAESKQCIVIVSDNEIILFSVCEEECVDLTSQNSEWIVDFGISYLATPQKHFVTSLNKVIMVLSKWATRIILKFLG